ncbi:MAG: hypothetical protein V1776_03915 [Candidatus Diapherotrites archaeon]
MGRVGRVARQKKSYIHQKYLPFTKKFAKEIEWKGRVTEIFQQNDIHLRGVKLKPKSILVELGSWKEKPGGLMLDYSNVMKISSHFGLKVKAEYSDRNGRAEHGNYFYREVGDGMIETLNLKESGELQAFKNPREYLELPSKVQKRRLGRIHSVVFTDNKGNHVFTYHHYVGREHMPQQFLTHRGYVEFFAHKLAPVLAKMLTERKARKTGPKYLKWLSMQK